MQTRADSQELDQFLKQEVEKFTRTLRSNEAQHSGEVGVSTKLVLAVWITVQLVCFASGMLKRTLTCVTRMLV